LQAVLLDYLRDQAEASAQGSDSHKPMGRIQVIATTHSPNLASSVGVENIVVLKTKRTVERVEEDEAEGIERRMTYALTLVKLGLSKKDLRKINQYLDATRAAMLFAKRIVLVEGIAEAVLLPVLARHCVFKDDRVGRRAFHAVTIITVGSVDFSPYVKLLLTPVDGLTAVDHLVVITDTDPPIENCDKSTKAKPVDRPAALWELAEKLGSKKKLTVAASKYTLEADLLNEKANTQVLRDAYLSQHPKSGDKWELISSAEDAANALYAKLRSDKDFISKGEFAHDIALEIADGKRFAVPAYLEIAIRGALAESGESGETDEA
jgi:putative ATP-dependent endonuclease of OLD family